MQKSIVYYEFRIPLSLDITVAIPYHIGIMNIPLSSHFTAKKLFRFVFPSVIMMLFTSVYGVVDGYFVSNFTGKTPFAAVNLILPFIMAIGFLCCRMSFKASL